MVSTAKGFVCSTASLACSLSVGSDGTAAWHSPAPCLGASGRASSNSYCGKRVGVLYSIGEWFGCRYCGEIAYAAQMEGGKYRWNGVSIPDIERAEKEVKRYYYNGKPTKRYRRYLRMTDKFDRGLMGMVARLDKNKRFAPNKK